MDVFKVGVSIAMSSNANAVLGVIQRDLFGLQRAVDLTTGKLNTLKLAAVGAMSAIAGAEALKGMWSLVEAGRELVHQQSLLRAAAISNVDIAEATAQAWKLAGTVAGTGVTENIKLIADLRNVLGGMGHAVEVSEQMARLGVVLNSVTGKSGEEGGYQFARFLELRGSLIDPNTHQISTERLSQQTRLGQAIIVAERGRVGPSDLLAFQQQARGAGAMLSDKGLLNAVPLIQAMGGFRAGTATAAINSNLIGGVMTQRSAAWLVEQGLLPDSAVKIGRGGQVKVDKNQLAGADLLASDQSAWVTTVLMPALAAKGIVDQDAITKAILQSGFRQTTTGGLIEYARNAATFEKSVANIQKALGVNQYDVLFGRGQTASDGRRDRDSYTPRTAEAMPLDPTVTMKAFHEAWGNLLTALGGPLVEPAMQMITKLTGVMTDMSQWAAAHPETVLILGEIGTAIAAAALAFGAFAIGTAAASALGLLTGATGLGALAAGIVAAGSALGVLPSWVVHIASAGIAGAAVGSVAGPGGSVVGGLIGAAGGVGYELGTGARRLYDGAPRVEGQGDYPLSYPNRSMIPPAANNNTPQRVTIDNVGEVGSSVGNAAANGTTVRIERGLSRQPTGTSGFDPRMSTPGMFAP